MLETVESVTLNAFCVVELAESIAGMRIIPSFSEATNGSVDRDTVTTESRTKNCTKIYFSLSISILLSSSMIVTNNCVLPSET